MHVQHASQKEITSVSERPDISVKESITDQPTKTNSDITEDAACLADNRIDTT